MVHLENVSCLVIVNLFIPTITLSLLDKSQGDIYLVHVRCTELKTLKIKMNKFFIQLCIQQLTFVHILCGATNGGFGFGTSSEMIRGLGCSLSSSNSPIFISTVICHAADISCMNCQATNMIYVTG